MRAPPARSTTAAACTPSVPPCPISSCAGARAARRGRRSSTAGPRAAVARVLPPAPRSVQEVRMQSKDCLPKIRIPPVLQTLQFPEVLPNIFCLSKAKKMPCHNLLSPRNNLAFNSFVNNNRAIVVKVRCVYWITIFESINQLQAWHMVYRRVMR